MRKLNSIITAAIGFLFLVHLVWGMLILEGLTEGGSGLFRCLSYLMLLLILLHIIIGVKLTYDTITIIRKSGVYYGKENRLFWVRRLSGFALILFLMLHIWLFSGQVINGVFRLREYTGFRMAEQLLLVASLAVHLISNIGPFRIALGIEDKRRARMDALVVLSVLLLLAAVAFVVYYLRWQRI